MTNLIVYRYAQTSLVTAATWGDPTQVAAGYLALLGSKSPAPPDRPQNFDELAQREKELTAMAGGEPEGTRTLAVPPVDSLAFASSPARRYASPVLAVNLCLCVCLSVCLSKVGVPSKRLQVSSWFLAYTHPSSLPRLIHRVLKNFGYLQK